MGIYPKAVFVSLCYSYIIGKRIPKGAPFALVIHAYDYKHYYIHPKLMYILYCLNVYLLFELLLAMVAYFTKALVGLELEAQFNEPHLWNISGASILRSTVYEPTQHIVVGTLFGEEMGGLVLSSDRVGYHLSIGPDA
ncbi:hypothetical protein NE237_006159 [Protea cynaroides]|uniref:Uncharacterized protein n=1 Tax=Protea cynaroides TaxID=273540 RepID=A0A9Q0QUW8_9MAGN|nr:hypothetical protein NE237_006159 [Protea cynaroides]